MYKLLPVWQGSKSYWVKKLQHYYGRDFVELFAGSAVLSINLGKTAILNDYDEMIYKILSKYDQLIVPEYFTRDDYLRVCKEPDWWKYAFCIMKYAFSGIFRYSDNGFNVAAKPIVKEIRFQSEYRNVLEKWKEI